MIILLSGYRGSGKDTAASYLVNHYGFTRLAFADALKDHVAEQYQVPRELLDSPAGKEAPLYSLPVVSTDSFSEAIHKVLSSELQSGFWTPRALLILEGSIKRAVAPQYWLLNIVNQIVTTDKVVISDWRYRSELEQLRAMELNPVTMRVSRYTSIDTQEASERDLDSQEFHHKIHNDQDIMGLHVQLDALMSQYHIARLAPSTSPAPVVDNNESNYWDEEEHYNLWKGYMD